MVGRGWAGGGWAGLKVWTNREREGSISGGLPGLGVILMQEDPSRKPIMAFVWPRDTIKIR